MDTTWCPLRREALAHCDVGRVQSREACAHARRLGTRSRRVDRDGAIDSIEIYAGASDQGKGWTWTQTSMDVRTRTLMSHAPAAARGRTGTVVVARLRARHVACDASSSDRQSVDRLVRHHASDGQQFCCREHRAQRSDHRSTLQRTPRCRRREQPRDAVASRRPRRRTPTLALRRGTRDRRRIVESVAPSSRTRAGRGAQRELICRRPARPRRRCSWRQLLRSRTSAQQPPASDPRRSRTAPAAGAAAPPAPLPNRANEVLPSWLRVRGEFRERMEGFDGPRLRRRTRRSATASVGSASTRRSRRRSSCRSRCRRRMRASADKTVGPTARRSGRRSICAWRSPTSAPRRARCPRASDGRSWSFGEQRLVGHVELGERRAHVRRRARDRSRSKAFQLDVVRRVGRAHPATDEFDKSGNGNRFVGAYADDRRRSIPQGLGRAVRVLAARREPARRSRARSAICSRRRSACAGRARLPARLDYGIEMAAADAARSAPTTSAPGPATGSCARRCRGRRAAAADRRIQLRLGRRRPDRRHARHVRSALSHRARQVRPGRSGRLAEHPPPARRRRAHAGQGHAGHGELPLVVAGRARRDGLYNASGAPLARVAGGAAGRHVGQEIDVQVSRALTPQLQLAAGYAHIFPARSSKQATPAPPTARRTSWLTYVFLADDSEMTMTSIRRRSRRTFLKTAGLDRRRC